MEPKKKEEKGKLIKKVLKPQKKEVQKEENIEEFDEKNLPDNFIADEFEPIYGNDDFDDFDDFDEDQEIKSLPNDIEDDVITSEEIGEEDFEEDEISVEIDENGDEEVIEEKEEVIENHVVTEEDDNDSGYELVGAEDEVVEKTSYIVESDDEEFDELDEEDYELVDDEELEEADEEEYELADDDEYEEVDDEEYEPVDDEEYEEVDDEEYEPVDDEEYEEVDEEYELAEDEEYEEVDDEEYELAEDEELEEVDDEEYELADDEEYEEVDEEEYELANDEELEEVDEEEYELADDEELEEVDDEEYELADDEEYESVDDEEYEEVDEEYELADDEEYEEVDDEEYELTDKEEQEEIDENTEDLGLLDDDDYANVELDDSDDESEYDNQEVNDEDDVENDEEYEEIEDENDEEYEEEYEDEGERAEYDFLGENEVEDDEEEEENEDGEIDDSFPEELVDIELECIFVGLLFNNPKAISRFYFLYEDCKFSNKELMNLYKIVLFRDGEAFAPAKAKDKYQLPRETPHTYDLKLKVRKIAASRNFNLENVYIELKKLFILKKNYEVAATSAIQQKILEIQDYELYADMTVEEVESALEQITVTTGLTQGRLNNDTTSFLLSGDNELSNGISLPFNILSTVFKGLRKGETMCYAMPSNSGKSRFTINLAAYIAYIHKQKVLIISNEMAEDKMKLCMITTILNNPEIQELHGQKFTKTEGELLELKFRPTKGKKVKCDENGYIAKLDDETHEEFIERLKENSEEFNQTLAVTEWVNSEVNNSIYFIHITEHTNDDLRKIIMNYYYKEGIQYMFYDTLKADTANIGNGEEVKKTATILSNLAQKFRIFIASSMQLLESSTLPVNLTINDMSASKTVKEVLDTLCLIKQISRQSLHKYEYADTDQFEKCKEIKVPKDTDVRFYACVVDKNRAGAKPILLFRLNLAYNRWEELGHLRLKQTEIEED